MTKTLTINECKTWQYNGCAKFSTVLAWCCQHLDIDDWHTNLYDTIWFENEAAYTLFLLKWQ